MLGHMRAALDTSNIGAGERYFTALLERVFERALDCTLVRAPASALFQAPFLSYVRVHVCSTLAVGVRQKAHRLTP